MTVCFCLVLSRSVTEPLQQPVSVANENHTSVQSQAVEVTESQQQQQQQQAVPSSGWSSSKSTQFTVSLSYPISITHGHNKVPYILRISVCVRLIIEVSVFPSYIFLSIIRETRSYYCAI